MWCGCGPGLAFHCPVVPEHYGDGAPYPLNVERQTMRLSYGRISILVLGAMLVTHAAFAAQQIRYIGRATAAALQNGATTGDVGAGGKDAKGNIIDDKRCDIRETSCFSESATAGAIPGALLTGTATTVGGAQFQNGSPNPGFPRVESTAQASLLALDGALSIAISPTRAIADSFTGELTAVGGPILINLGGTPITLPSGEGIVLPGLLTLLPMHSKKTNGNGLSQIEVDGAILDPDSNGPLASLGPVILGHAVAGIEEPFTEGGGGGGGACAVSHVGTSSGGLELLAVVGVLWGLSRRRRAPH
jgi:hypothetical protein